MQRLSKSSRMNAGLFFVCSVLLAVSVTALPVSYTQEGHLRIMEASNNILEAIYFDTEMGIRIKGDSQSLMIVSMIDNEVLVSGQKPQGSSSKLTSVMGSTFIKFAATNQESQSRYSEYSVPKSLVDQTKAALEAGKEDRLLSLLGEQNEAETHETLNAAVKRLFERSELGILESASFALARAGIVGYENQGALNFYGVAMAVVKQLYRQNEGSEQENRDQEMQQDGLFPKELQHNRSKHYAYQKCEWSPDYCLSGKCKEGTVDCNGYCPIGPFCLGRCGPGCGQCWSYICGNCCYYQGCYDHDMCCEDWWSTGCWFPVPFSCNGYSCY